jgi:hypothetical protein
MKNLYLFDAFPGKLYVLDLKNSKELLKLHPGWAAYDSEDDRLSDVKNFFRTRGKVVASQTAKNLLATY